MNGGVLIISLDFELTWGVHDVLSLNEYRENLLGVQTAIPRLLDLFGRYRIHATWGTVGLLFFKSKEEMVSGLPSLKPTYRNRKYSPYDNMDSIGPDEQADLFHFAPTLIKKIAEAPYQEIGTHTFSHYYCQEEGQTIEQFEADIKAAMDIADKRGIKLKTILFPRNQTNIEYLAVCRKYGIIAYRGNELSRIYESGSYQNYQSPFKRLLRITDSYINLTGHHIYNLPALDDHIPKNLPSSRFLRPYNPKLKMIEPLRIHRIKKSMAAAAQENKVYHLWWHPHNFGKHQEENLENLTEILEHYLHLKIKYGMSSLNMTEATFNKCYDSC
ncbi:polysaccharide deacetylase family protein [Bacillus sp. ISL-39]|uniref:polysaccharide deacetylase family protein n=1 Tax=Bacillus sp. ISL-39 TaxID=2819124 RepID=UPI001BED3C55|nr:polysaccharide deacetylase family protein [Bacillus sp. ISL-39]MBT2639680.1 polysaccharide deacetylase family protein [Bacillus sp. ISL-39]